MGACVPCQHLGGWNKSYLIFISYDTAGSFVLQRLFSHTGGSDNIRRVFTLIISELAILVSVNYLFYAAEWTVLDYYVGFLHFKHVASGMLLPLLTPCPNALSYFRFYEIIEVMRRDTVIVALAFYRVTGIDWSSSWGSDDFIFYDLATGTVQEYTAERPALLKCQKIDDGPVVPELAPTSYVSCISGVAHKAFLDDKSAFRR